MALDKLVDSTQLDADMTTVANAIRTRGGTSAQLSFPGGMAQAIADIPGGGGATEPYIEETYDANGKLTNAVLHGYTKIRAYLFHTCNLLKLTTLPDEITEIGIYAFVGCNGLKLTSLPSALTDLKMYAFHQCYGLPLTSLPDGLTAIGQNCFSDCRGLRFTLLPSALGYIGSNAFNGCTGLTSLTFQSTPWSLASSAFRNCTNLLTINVPWASGAVSGAPWGATNATINYNYTGA